MFGDYQLPYLPTQSSECCVFSKDLYGNPLIFHSLLMKDAGLLSSPLLLGS